MLIGYKNMNNETFGKKLIRLRTEKRISQQKLAEFSSYTQTYISLIETDKANPSERCRKSLLKVIES